MRVRNQMQQIENKSNTIFFGRTSELSQKCSPIYCTLYYYTAAAVQLTTTFFSVKKIPPLAICYLCGGGSTKKHL